MRALIAAAAGAFVLATAGTAAGAGAGGSVGPSYTVSLVTGTAQIEGEVTCFQADSAQAVLTLSQRGSGTQTQTFTTACGSASFVPFVVAFTGFHPGRATLQVCFYAFSTTTGNDVGCSGSFQIVLVPTH